MSENFKAGSKVRVKDFIGSWAGVEGIVTEDGKNSDRNGHKITVTVDPHNNGRVGHVHRLFNLELLEGDYVKEEPKVETIAHPQHYGGDTTYETIKVAEAWGLDKDSYLFNVLKYISRSGKKGAELEDLKKGAFYLNRRIARLEEGK